MHVKQQLSLAAMLFFIYSYSAFVFCFFFNIHWFESRFTETRVLLFFFWTNSIDYNSTEWFISRSLLVLFGKKSLVYWICSEESKNGKSQSYGKSWIEAYRLLYNEYGLYVSRFFTIVYRFFFRGKLNFKVARVRQEEFDPQSMPSVAHDRYLKSK